jgi:hypothetical protein
VPLPDQPHLDEHHELRKAARTGHRPYHKTGLTHVEHEPRDLQRSSAADHLMIDHHAADSDATAPADLAAHQ